MRMMLIVFAALTASIAAAQQPIDLATAQQMAIQADPRMAELQLEQQQTELRLRNIDMERRPALALQAQAQYQSEVVELPIRLPTGGAPTAPKDQYDASLNVDQLLVDPSRRARLAAERSRLTEAQARIRTTLYTLRQEVNETFFAAALLQEREAQIAASIGNLEARLREARLRVNAGTALASDAASIEATLLQRREDVAELQANRRAALERLSKLTGRELTASEPLAIPTLGAAFSDARVRSASLRDRPEFAQLAAARERLESQKELTRAEQQPRVSAYGKFAYGKPGLNFLKDELHPYWLAGVRVQWKPWDWGKGERDRRIAELQQESISADDAALARTLERSIQNDLATADRLQGTLSTDDRIVELRELIERETRARYDERVVTAADYVEKESDVLQARLLRAAHRVELAQAQARVLNTLGVEIR